MKSDLSILRRALNPRLRLELTYREASPLPEQPAHDSERRRARLYSR